MTAPEDNPDDDMPDDREKCEACDGAGWVYDEEDGGTKTCETCDGEGGV